MNARSCAFVGGPDQARLLLLLADSEPGAHQSETGQEDSCERSSQGSQSMVDLRTTSPIMRRRSFVVVAQLGDKEVHAHGKHCYLREEPLLNLGRKVLQLDRQRCITGCTVSALNQHVRYSMQNRSHLARATDKSTSRTGLCSSANRSLGNNRSGFPETEFRGQRLWAIRGASA